MSDSGKFCSNGEEVVENEWDESAMAQLNEILSDSGKEWIPMFNSEAESVPPKIDILISIVCRIFDELKNDFIRQLECAKEELSTSVTEHNAQWIDTSQKIKARLEKSAVKNQFFKSLVTQFHFDFNCADQ